MADEPIRKPRIEQGLMPPESPAVESLEETETGVDAEAPAQEVEIQEEAPEPVRQEVAAQAPEPAPVAAQVVPQKDRLSQEIESVLQEDLTDIYLKMPPGKQKQFAAKGEETAGKIKKLMTKAKINARKVFGLIRDWLKIIPGVNKFFLEQEAKIKTDKLLLVAEEEKRHGSQEIA
jgi:hypothetical protein